MYARAWGRARRARAARGAARRRRGRQPPAPRASRATTSTSRSSPTAPSWCTRRSTTTSASCRHGIFRDILDARRLPGRRRTTTACYPIDVISVRGVRGHARAVHRRDRRRQRTHQDRRPRPHDHRRAHSTTSRTGCAARSTGSRITTSSCGTRRRRMAGADRRGDVDRARAGRDHRRELLDRVRYGSSLPCGVRHRERRHRDVQPPSASRLALAPTRA